jgi:5-methylcytosine-specific restriction endonuclease McrA
MTKTRIQKAIEWKEQTRQLVMQRDDFRCVKCNDDETVSVKVSELHTHHIQPLNLGGLDTMNNMITL